MLGEHGIPLSRSLFGAAQRIEGYTELHRRIAEPGVTAQHAAKLRDRAIRKSGIAQCDAESISDVGEARAAVERLAVGLDGLAQVTHFAVGVSESGLEVRELAAGGRVEHVICRARHGSRTLRDLAGTLEITLALVDVGEGEQGLRVGGIDPQRFAKRMARPISSRVHIYACC